MSTTLRFDEVEHKYYDEEGREIPSVSEILRFLFREVYEEPNKAQMDIAADRGTRVHKACQELDERGQTEADDDIAGYVRAYIKFAEEHEYDWKGVERIIHGENVYGGFAGTLDRYGTLDGEGVVLDIKTTSKITKKHQLLYACQMSAYWLGLMCEPVDLPKNLAILQLKNDGTYKLIYVDKKVEEFNACLQLHYAVNATKRKKKGAKANG